MCDPPRRRWAQALHPSRLALAVVALAVVIVGTQLSGAAGVSLIGVGAVMLLIAAVLPAIHEVEVGFPSGIRVVAGLHERSAQLRSAFERERPELQLCAALLCRDDVVAAQLIEAAGARAAATWRGPITPYLRTYLLCNLVELMTAEARWGRRPAPSAQLEELEPTERLVLVLSEFASLTLEEITLVIHRDIADVAAALDSAHARLAAEPSDGRS